MTRVTFLVDGFNMYHSLIEASRDSGGGSTKWLDLKSLLAVYLSVVGPQARIEEIYYFTALAKQLDSKKPGTTARHRAYIECLQSKGVIPILGRFKYKEVHCQVCRKSTPHYEEKETDVAISIKLLELFMKDRADTIVLVSGDTDLAPAIRTAQTLFPAKEVCCGFPYKRKNAELAQLVSKHFRIGQDQYRRHQFPDPVVLSTGRQVPKPSAW